jgi:hypothetical protein
MAPLARDAEANRMGSARQSTKCSIMRVPARFESSASSDLELAAVFVEEILLAECTAFAAAVKRQPPKHSNEVTTNFKPTTGKHW